MDKEKTTFLSDEGIDLIKEAADKNKNVNLMFLAEILRELRGLKKLFEQQDNGNNRSSNSTNST